MASTPLRASVPLDQLAGDLNLQDENGGSNGWRLAFGSLAALVIAVALTDELLSLTPHGDRLAIAVASLAALVAFACSRLNRQPTFTAQGTSSRRPLGWSDSV
ncbi:MAG: hypothetical protein C0606_08620 [Hyphomicrobiales bacterium]|nr:MAG: hypothetical protein C0606_08620 [Hyphomicrobiales bacterium]